MHDLEELCGTIDKVIFKSPENGFSVFALKVRNTDIVTAKGFLPEVHQGEQVTLKGKWIFHAKFGRQFDAHECVASLPSSIIGIQRYLSSGLIKGIGPKFAEKLVNHFGEKTLDIIDQTPNRLFEVSGVGEKRIFAITEAWQDQKEISRVMVFLRSKDVSPSFAVKIYKAYGNQAIEKIQANPYRLVDDIWGIGFKSADTIALKLGLEKNAPDRIKAGFLYVLGEATNNGHLYVEVEQAKETVLKILELDPDINLDTHLDTHKETAQTLLKHALVSLYQQDKIKLITDQDKHFLSLPKFYFSEKGIATKIKELLARKPDPEKFDINAIYQSLRMPDERGVELHEHQQRGILTCLQNKISIVTGGPGTGKTTTVKRLIKILEEHKVRFRLAAPTGRAAKRMFESTGRNTETLHRLLEFAPVSMGFARNEQNALELDFLIVDEASMIDVFLMYSILKALPQAACLVLLGDIDQLPSVGAGNILNDLIASEKIEVVRLTEVFRQAQDSLIIVNAHRVNNGEFPQPALPGSKKDFVYLKEEEPENTFGLLRTIYTKKLAQLGINPDDAVVLVPMNKGTVGAQRLNQELQMILNPAQDGQQSITQFGQAYRIGDRVMQIRNNYDKFVFNGDMGKIIAIDKVEQKLIISFGERELEYDFAELNELTLAYAISIHKSQGSEFQAVIIPIFMQHFILLQRNLIYTAITRAKKLCILIGQPKAISMGIRNAKGIDRKTFLKEFLTTDLEAR